MSRDALTRRDAMVNCPVLARARKQCRLRLSQQSNYTANDYDLRYCC